MKKKNGLQDVTIHDFRHSFAAAMASNNINVAIIKSALNHKDLKTTLNVYAHTTKNAELEAKQIIHKVWRERIERTRTNPSASPLSPDAS